MSISGIYPVERAIEIIKGARSRQAAKDLKAAVVPYLEQMYHIRVQQEELARRQQYEAAEWTRRANESAEIQRQSNINQMQDQHAFDTNEQVIIERENARIQAFDLQIQNELDPERQEQMRQQMIQEQQRLNYFYES